MKIYSNTDKQQKLILAEMVLTIVSMILVYFILTNQFWNYEFVQVVLDDWYSKPIVDFKAVWVMDDNGNVPKYPKECPSGYEEVGQAPFFGFKQGCICPGNSFVNVDD